MKEKLAKREEQAAARLTALQSKLDEITTELETIARKKMSAREYGAPDLMRFLNRVRANAATKLPKLTDAGTTPEHLAFTTSIPARRRWATSNAMTPHSTNS